ncbi:uncharacterized protein LOC114126048 isoform X6 [Aphis gossypii]|uniref:uncharacterized protein LOC114126048 isoform X4 n=1 Tax=Aphis gossypii TaxID=80765 RepID=UPI002158A76D|nr:uncharacterized protein LOC114126048 isoform X4 [Aphis gossypii]XP_050057537.1 uncharacterized protein LOC114126048 isoform X6 [Aphis gossypii]XP_050057538.1 uncharacterized protein LOC114126048 isoform X6 [Aphis gossypii]
MFFTAENSRNNEVNQGILAPKFANIKDYNKIIPTLNVSLIRLHQLTLGGLSKCHNGSSIRWFKSNNTSSTFKNILKLLIILVALLKICNLKLLINFFSTFKIVNRISYHLYVYINADEIDLNNILYNMFFTAENSRNNEVNQGILAPKFANIKDYNKIIPTLNVSLIRLHQLTLGGLSKCHNGSSIRWFKSNNTSSTFKNILKLLILLVALLKICNLKLLINFSTYIYSGVFTEKKKPIHILAV